MECRKRMSAMKTDDIVPDDMSRKELVDLAYKLLDEINDQQEEIRDLKDELEERHDEMLFRLKYPY